MKDSKGEMLFVPDSNWLEKEGWEYVDFRMPLVGEIFLEMVLDAKLPEKYFRLSICRAGEFMPSESASSSYTCARNALVFEGKRWILRPSGRKETKEVKTETTTPPGDSISELEV